MLPARVADYRPAMLDELIASGEVVWQARPHEESASSQKGSGQTGGGEWGSTASAGIDDVVALGEIAFFPTDSALAPVVGEALTRAEFQIPRNSGTEENGESATGEDTKDDAKELWRLVCEGAATGRSFEPVRRSLEPAAGPRSAPARRVRSRRSRRLMVGMPRAGGRTASGRLPSVLSSASWLRLSQAPVSAEERAIAEVESLLDRYGVVSRDVALSFGGSGGLVPLMPVLRRMEDTGAILRGEFVEGLGPAQFAERETVDRLRFLGQEQAGARGSGTVVVLDLKDPACLVGRGPAWPEPALPAGIGKVGIKGEEAGGAPQRRRGASVILIEGAPVLYASDSLKVLISYTSEREVLTRALGALATARQGALAREGSPPGRHRTVVESLNGVSALDRTVSDLLRQAGFVSDPRGMRLAVGPYGASFSR